jgi:hypothetical protein
MNIELTPENAAALSKYAALAGCTPTEFLNRYLTDNMVAPFQNPRTGDIGETCENKGVHWIEATTTANGLTYPRLDGNPAGSPRPGQG